MRWLVLLVVVLGLGEASAQGPCITNTTTPFASYGALNTANWEGRVVGFCQDLFGATDVIYPQTSLSCSGEMGQFQSLRNGLGALGNTCRNSMARFYCYVALPLLRTNNGIPIGIGLPCTAEQASGDNSTAGTLATWISSACAAELDTVESLLPTFGLIDAQLAASPGLVSLCRVVNGDIVFEASWAASLWECPEGLTKKRGSDLNTEEAGCALPCPAPVYSDAQYDAVETILAVINSVSFCAILFTLASWLLIKGKLAFPSNLVFHLLANIAVLHVAFLIRKDGTFENVWCVDDYTPADQSHVACGVQATLVSYAGKACVIWWFIITLNGFLVFVTGNHTTELLVHYYLVAGYAYPCLAPIVGLSWNKLDYSLGSAWCFVTSDSSGAYQYGLFYVELMTLIFVGAMMGVATLTLLGRQDREMDSSRARTTVGKRQRHTFRSKVIVLLFWVGFELIWVLAFRVDGTVREDDIRGAMEDWARCKFAVFTTQLDSPDYSSCAIDHKPTFALLILALFFISGNGLMVFGLFGWSEDVRLFWVLLAKHTVNTIRGRPDDVVERRLFALTNFLYRDQLRARNAGRKAQHENPGKEMM